MPDSIAMERIMFAYGPMPILRNVNLTAQRGRITVISGKSGNGMSTLLEICVGLLVPKFGSVKWDGADLASMAREEQLRLRQSIGYMFQTGALISNFTVFENIALPLRSRGLCSDEEIDRRVRDLMEELLLFNVDTHYPEALSAFQSRAAALARALINEPSMLLLDDPIGGVDPGTAQGLLNIIEDRWKRTSMGIIMICHDQDIWTGLPVQRLVLEAGVLSPYDPGMV
ncbi:MAG: ATP-binding cassette domain-containing protein [Chitinispirillaceae bacterium]|nr:ATP-binding cassette domain-containing protein [Chitinispirillaceae bacterium]